MSKLLRSGQVLPPNKIFKDFWFLDFFWIWKLQVRECRSLPLGCWYVSQNFYFQVTVFSRALCLAVQNLPRYSYLNVLQMYQAQLIQSWILSPHSKFWSFEKQTLEHICVQVYWECSRVQHLEASGWEWAAELGTERSWSVMQTKQRPQLIFGEVWGWNGPSEFPWLEKMGPSFCASTLTSHWIWDAPARGPNLEQSSSLGPKKTCGPSVVITSGGYENGGFRPIVSTASFPPGFSVCHLLRHPS